jgi:hypothetical protein
VLLSVRELFLFQSQVLHRQRVLLLRRLRALRQLPVRFPFGLQVPPRQLFLRVLGFQAMVCVRRVVSVACLQPSSARLFR